MTRERESRPQAEAASRTAADNDILSTQACVAPSRSPKPFTVACPYCEVAPFRKCHNAMTGRAMRKQIAHPCRFTAAKRVAAKQVHDG